MKVLGGCLVLSRTTPGCSGGADVVEGGAEIGVAGSTATLSPSTGGKAPDAAGGGALQGTARPSAPPGEGVGGGDSVGADSRVGSDDSDCKLDPNSALWTAIANSDTDASSRARLCACFAELSGGPWGPRLTELFETGTPEVLATALENIGSCCSTDGLYAPALNLAPTDDVWNIIVSGHPGELCSVPVNPDGSS